MDDSLTGDKFCRLAFVLYCIVGSPSKGGVNLQEELWTDSALNMAMDESLTGDAFWFSLMKINLIMRA